jgi:hypothetical protein
VPRMWVAWISKDTRLWATTHHRVRPGWRVLARVVVAHRIVLLVVLVVHLGVALEVGLDRELASTRRVRANVGALACICNVSGMPDE